MNLTKRIGYAILGFASALAFLSVATAPHWTTSGKLAGAAGVAFLALVVFGIMNID